MFKVSHLGTHLEPGDWCRDDEDGDKFHSIIHFLLALGHPPISFPRGQHDSGHRGQATVGLGL